MRSTVRFASLAACIAYLAGASLANGADMPLPAPAAPISAPVYAPASVPWVVGNQFEARLGVFAAGIGSVEEGTFDINASFLTPRLNLGLPGYWAYALPRLRLGGALNVEGRTSFAYADAVFTLPITQWLFFEPFIGGAIHDGSIVATPTMSGLGCHELFHAGVSLGVPITEHWNVMGTFEHLSNGKGIFGVDCGTNQTPTGSNQGLNNYGISIGYAF